MRQRSLRYLAALLLIICALQLYAQAPSMRKAVLLSALLPGAGEYYCGNTVKGTIFMTTDLAILFGWWRFDQEKEWTRRSYEDMALAYAGIPKDSRGLVYQRAQQYMSSDDYNDYVVQEARNYYLIYQYDPDGYEAYVDSRAFPVEESWNWQNKDSWRDYQKLRLRHQDIKIYGNFMVAAAFLNRLISVVDTAISVRSAQKADRGLGLSVVPDFVNEGLVLRYEYRF